MGGVNMHQRGSEGGTLCGFTDGMVGGPVTCPNCLSLRPAVARAWSEGYRDGVDDMTGTETLEVVRRNPYRVVSE